MKIATFSKDGRLIPFRGAYRENAINIQRSGYSARLPFHWKLPPEFEYADKNTNCIEIKRADLITKHRNFVILQREFQPSFDIFFSTVVNLPKGFTGHKPLVVEDNPRGIFYDFSFPRGESPYFSVRGFLLVPDERMCSLVNYNPSTRETTKTTYQNQAGNLIKMNEEKI